MLETTETIRRVTIICTPDQRHDVLAWMYKRGYQIIRMGPKRLSVGMVSTTEYEVVAEVSIADPVVVDFVHLPETPQITNMSGHAGTKIADIEAALQKGRKVELNPDGTAVIHDAIEKDTSTNAEQQAPKPRIDAAPKPRLRIHVAADPHAISASICGVDIGPWLQEWRQGIIDGHPMWKLTLIVHPSDIELV